MGTVRYTVANGQILAEKRAGNHRFYRSDALGSTVSLYDSNQTKTDSFTYWPYGETRTSSGSTGTKYKFVGTLGCRTQADGGIYMRARVQQPKDSRWMTVDPLWYAEPAFTYASSSPATYVDRYGTQIFICPLPSPGPPPSPYEQHKKCLSDAIRKHCGDLMDPGNPLSRGRWGPYLYSIAWCIIDVESGGWNPNARTHIGNREDPAYCEYALGYFQIVPRYWDKFCRSLGYGNWKTDPCQNIGCGVAILCKCLRESGDLESRQCKRFFNAIYHPKFKPCLCSNFGIWPVCVFGTPIGWPWDLDPAPPKPWPFNFRP